MIPECIRQQVATVAIRTYAAHSYIYYVKSYSIISDAEFDELCRWLLVNHNWIAQYDLNKYLEVSALSAGTGFQLKICGQTKDYAESIYKDYLEKNKKHPGSEFA